MHKLALENVSRKPSNIDCHQEGEPVLWEMEVEGRLSFLPVALFTGGGEGLEVRDVIAIQFQQI